MIFLEKQAAISKPKYAAWDIDQYELHSHPDLTERLLEVVSDLDIRPLAAFGVTCVGHPNGVVMGLVRGGFVLFLRLGGLVSDGRPRPEIGPDWFAFDAFPSSLNKEAGTASLKRLAKESWVYAAGLAPNDRIDSGSVTLQRFWFAFELPPIGEEQPPSWAALRLGCGATGYDESDCRAIIEADVLGSDPWPRVTSVTADIDVRTLDQRHVVPNMDPPTWRGVWFPRGFRSLVS